jgi:alginate O-acetyltransferase complex protein AlgJ
VASTLRRDLPPFNPAPAGAPPLAVTNTGDTAMMLALPSGHRLRRPEGVVIHPVERAVSDAADVLLLGDSFSNIYSLHGMGWGSGAGFAERLAFHLGRPVRAFVRNDGGAWGSRDRLARALARGDATLEGVRVVVWQFSDRELAHGDWKTIGVPEAPAPRPQCVAPSTAGADRTVACTGMLEAASSGPRLDAPYSDFIIKWHVTGLVAASGAKMPDEAVVMLFGMRQRTILPTASLRPGRRVALRLRPWEEVERRYGTLNAGTLDDPMLEIDSPLFWAEGATEASK